MLLIQLIVVQKYLTMQKNIKKYMHLVLPGVGSFKSGIKALKIKNWPEAIYEHVELKKSLLGICLGMQLLFTKGSQMAALLSSFNCLRGAYNL